MKKIILTTFLITNLFGQFTNFYNKNLKLISDSEIMINRNTNKLVSNSIIYGQFFLKNYYERNGVKNTICNKFPNIYKIINECQITIYPSGDKLYTRANRIAEIEKLNPSTHMIECQYNQEYGIMHDCQVKIYHFNIR